VLIKSLKST